MHDRCCVNDLRNKEVINVCDGRRLGCVVDVEFNVCDGRIIALVVPGESKQSLFGKCEGMSIPWCKIEKIGDDIILVNIGEIVCHLEECCDNNKKKRLF